MEADQQDIYFGLSAGLSRVESSLGKKFSLEDFPDLRVKLEEAFRIYPGELNTRFVTLFAEMAVVSESSRRIYAEPSLTVAELRSFLDHATKFFNSFIHK